MVASRGRERSISAGLPAPLLLALGALLGLTWAAGLRGLMAEIAGRGTEVTWSGTFGWILLPGVAVGALLAWAEHVRRSGGRRGWRWLALSPLLFASVLLTGLDDPTTLLEAGVGGGTIGVPVLGMIGGYAASSRGPLWGRLAAGALAFSAIPVWALTATAVGGPELALTRPRGAWVAVYYYSLLAVLALGCSIPHRPLLQPSGSESPKEPA